MVCEAVIKMGELKKKTCYQKPSSLSFPGFIKLLLWTCFGMFDFKAPLGRMSLKIRFLYVCDL